MCVRDERSRRCQRSSAHAEMTVSATSERPKLSGNSDPAESGGQSAKELSNTEPAFASPVGHAINMNSSFTFEVGGGEPPSSQPAWDLGGAVLALHNCKPLDAAIRDGQTPFFLLQSPCMVKVATVPWASSAHLLRCILQSALPPTPN